MTDLTDEQKQFIMNSLNEIDSQLKAVDRNTLNETGKVIYDTFAAFLDKFRVLK